MRDSPSTQGALWPRALVASRALCYPCMRNVLTWHRVLCDRQVFDEVEKLVIDVASFATSLATDLAKFINNLPTPERLMQMAGDYVQGKLLDEDGLCLAPSCPGSHINSGKEKDLVPDLEGLEILASHTTSPTHIAPTDALQSRPRMSPKYFPRIIYPHQPPLSYPHCLDHS